MAANTYSSETLTAYIDGELDAALAAEIDESRKASPELDTQLEALNAQTASLRSAFDEMLEDAPNLEALINRSNRNASEQPNVGVSEVVQLDTSPRVAHLSPSNSNVRNGMSRRGMMAMAASVLVAVGISGPAGYYGAAVTNQPDWRMEVANYQALYVTGTLDHVVPELASQEMERQRVVAQLGIDIPMSALQSSLADYKRGQILGFEGKPLAQFAYLTQDGKPIALCITRSGEPDQDIAVSNMRGLAAANWSANGIGYILIGTEDQKLIEQMAEQIRSRV